MNIFNRCEITTIRDVREMGKYIRLVTSLFANNGFSKGEDFSEINSRICIFNRARTARGCRSCLTGLNEIVV